MKTRNDYWKNRRAELKQKRRCERCGDPYCEKERHVLCPACREIMATKARDRRVSHKLVF